MQQARKHEYKGEAHTIEEWAAIKNIKTFTLRRRFQRGWSIEECLEKPLCRGHYSKNYPLTYKGETKALWEWGRILNIPYTIIYKRYKYGWTTEDILERPIRARRSNHSPCDRDCFNCKFDDCING